MNLSDSQIQSIVTSVMTTIKAQESKNGCHGVFEDMNVAIEEAKKSQKIVAHMSIDQREKSFQEYE